MTSKSKISIKNFISKGSFCFPFVVLISALIYSLFIREKIPLGDVRADAVISSVISVMLPAMLLVKLYAPKKISVASNRLNTKKLYIIPIGIGFVLSVLIASQIIFLTSGIGGGLIPFWNDGFSSDVSKIIFILVIPSIIFELFFRGIFISEYLKYGSLASAFSSAAFYSLFSLSIQRIIPLFLIGICLSAIRIYTDSVCAPIIIKTVSVIAYAVSVNSGIFEMAMEHMFLFASVISVIMLFCAFIILLSVSGSSPNYTAYEEGEYGRKEKLIAAVSPFMIIMIILTVYMR